MNYLKIRLIIGRYDLIEIENLLRLQRYKLCHSFIRSDYRQRLRRHG